VHLCGSVSFDAVDSPFGIGRIAGDCVDIEQLVETPDGIRFCSLVESSVCSTVVMIDSNCH